MAVVVVGDLITDTVVQLQQVLARGGDSEATVTDTMGGQGANVARWLCRADVSDVRLVAAASRHDLADHRGVLRLIGVQPDLHFFDAPVPRIVVMVDPSGSERSFLTQRGASMLLDAPHAAAIDLSGIHWCHVSGYLLATESGRRFYVHLRERCSAAKIPVSVDPASISMIQQHGADHYLQLIGRVALLIPNHLESVALTGESEPGRAAQLLREWTDVVVVKLGSDGALSLSSQSGLVRTPAVAATAIDPTGAGDAFCAGVIAGISKGQPLPKAVGFGARLGAQAVQTIGAY
jgi:sugar/nucleoside kinase (ribokinase family)